MMYYILFLLISRSLIIDPTYVHGYDIAVVFVHSMVNRLGWSELCLQSVIIFSNFGRTETKGLKHNIKKRKTLY